MDAKTDNALPHFLQFVPQKAEPDEIMAGFFMAIDALGIVPYKAQQTRGAFYAHGFGKIFGCHRHAF